MNYLSRALYYQVHPKYFQTLFSDRLVCDDNMSGYFSWDALKAYMVLFFCLVLPLVAVIYYHEQSKITFPKEEIGAPSTSKTIEESEEKSTTKKHNYYEVSPLVNRDYFPTLIERIDQADTSIKVLMYLFLPPKKGDPKTSPKGIRDHLLQAAERGVNIDIILSLKDAPSPELSITHLTILKQLQHPNINGFINDGPNKLHTKTLLFDRDEVITGAHNWTYSSINNTHEVSLWIRSDQPLKEFHQWFDRIRSYSKSYNKIKKASRS